MSRETKPQFTMTFTGTREIDDIDRAKMRGLAVLLTKIARRLLAEEKARPKDTEVASETV